MKVNIIGQVGINLVDIDIEVKDEELLEFTDTLLLRIHKAKTLMYNGGVILPGSPSK